MKRGKIHKELAAVNEACRIWEKSRTEKDYKAYQEAVKRATLAAAKAYGCKPLS